MNYARGGGGGKSMAAIFSFSSIQRDMNIVDFMEWCRSMAPCRWWRTKG